MLALLFKQKCWDRIVWAFITFLLHSIVSEVIFHWSFMLIRFSLCLLNKKCSNWLLSYNSKTLTFLIVLVLLAGVGKGAEPSTVWAWLGCYSISQNHHWGSVGLGGRKRWTYTTSAPFCSIPSSGKLPASSTVDSVPLSCCPSLPILQEKCSSKCWIQPSLAEYYWMQPSPRSSAVQEQSIWAGHYVSEAAWSSLGDFSTVVFCSLEFRGGEHQAAGTAAISPFVSGDYMVLVMVLSTILSLSQEAMWNWAMVMSTFVCVNHPLFVYLC